MTFSVRTRAGFPVPAKRPIAAFSLLIAFALASIAQAQTIVPNGNLDTQLLPWNAWVSAAPDPVGSGAAPLWSATPDLLNSSASGSARIAITTSSPATNAASGFAQCVDFAVPTTVTFINYGFNFWVPATTVRDGAVSATAEVRLFSAAGCNGFIGGAIQSQALTSSNVPAETWYSVGDTGFVPPGAPLLAASAEVRGYLRQNGTTPTQTAYAIQLDRSLLVLNNTTPVELTRFSVE